MAKGEAKAENGKSSRDGRARRPAQAAKRRKSAVAAPKIEINDQFRAALDELETGSGHLFVTGRAGTGKSTLLRLWRDRTKRSHVVLAPTGIAALNVGGKTIHSFFGFGPAVTPAVVRREAKFVENTELYEKLDTVVIDEVSMVRADLLDCVDTFLRLHGPHRGQAFGGVRLVFFGDLFQLPPVVTPQQKAVLNEQYETPFFFSARAFVAADKFPVRTIQLDQVYRQRDEDFIAILDAIRTGRARDEHFSALARRHEPSFQPADDEFWIRLTATNEAARHLNEIRLDRLSGPVKEYEAHTTGNLAQDFSPPTEPRLKLKEGAQVMFVANDPLRRWVNGTMGQVVGFEEDDGGHETVNVELADGEIVAVAPHTWETYDWYYDDDAGHIDSKSVGAFVQYPLRLAWAITIHKSQGQTFDRVIIDLDRGLFAAGQLYVALSRCRTLGGMVFIRPIRRGHMLVDYRVVKFMVGDGVGLGRERRLPPAEIRELLLSAVRNRERLVIEYVKPGGSPEARTVTPLEVGELYMNDHVFEGLRAHCHERGEERHFRLDRIIGVDPVGHD